MEYDVFICHASEDKDFVEPLSQSLISKGLKVWYAPIKLKIGDSLRQEIDRGLANSRYGVVVLSEVFFKKNWTQSELDALASRQNEEGRKVILPIWHKIDAGEVQKHSPLLASLYAARSGDGLEIVAAQILNICSEPDETAHKSVFQTSGPISLREKCLDVIRKDDVLEWRKLVDELQEPVTKQLLEWKQDGEASIQQGADAWKESLLRATKICMPGFVPIFASVEAGRKERWKDAVRILHRLAMLKDKMGGGITDVLKIGWDMLYLPGSIGMAIAVETGQHDFVWDWMLMKMPGYIEGSEIKWADIRSAFWSPVAIDYKDPFRLLLGFYDSEYVQRFFPSEERMKEFLFKANLLQSIVELRLLTREQKGAEIVEKHDKSYYSNVMIVPFWCLIEPSDFSTWSWDLFGSGDGFIKFFMTNAQGHVDQKKIWDWWKGWRAICKTNLDYKTSLGFPLCAEWLILPGEPQK